jgi:type I restriction enzyme S subunit
MTGTVEPARCPFPMPLPDGWRALKLGECCRLVTDGDWIETKDQGGSHFRLLQVSNIAVGAFRETGNFRYITQETFDRLRCHEVVPDHVLVARMPDPVGRAWHVRDLAEPAITAVDVAIVETEPSVLDPGYLAYYLNSPFNLAHAAMRSSGTTRARITRRDLETFPVPVPPIAVQKRIASLLRNFDRLAEVNNRRIEILEDITRLTYREWFVHFRFPGHEDVELAESHLGPIPEGWDVTSLAEHVELQRRNVMPADFPEEEFDHYSIPAFDADRLPVVEPGSQIKSGKYQLDANCVLLSKLNPRFARVWRVSPGRSARRSACSTEFLVLKDTGDWPDPFVFSLVSDADFGARLASMAGGTSTSHQRAKPKDVMTLPVVGPPKDLVATFSERVRPMLDLAANLFRQNDVLSKARDLLLPRLISGELDVHGLDLDFESVA